MNPVNRAREGYYISNLDIGTLQSLVKKTITLFIEPRFPSLIRIVFGAKKMEFLGFPYLMGFMKSPVIFVPIKLSR